MVYGVLMSLFCMVGVAFFTLLERKIIGYSQARIGPIRAGGAGILQAFMDVVKLFSKSMTIHTITSKTMYVIFPLISVMIMAFFWSMSPNMAFDSKLYLGFIVVVSLSSITGLSIIVCGWSSSSMYSLLGSIRGLAQFCSYEVVFSFCVCMLCLLSGSWSFIPECSSEKGFFVILGLPILIVMFICVLAETQRSPFDFAEGESELVSGFNTEYSSVLFSMIFLAEYGMLMFFSYIIVLLTFPFIGFLPLILFAVGTSSILVLIRCSYPRLRYDILQNLSWKFLLPLVLMMFTISMLL